MVKNIHQGQVILINNQNEHPGRRHRNYENNSYQREKEPPKYYRNNPHKYNTTSALNNLGGGTLIAQKICNIVIKGDSSNIEKESTSLSNNRRRLITGLLFGFGYMYVFMMLDRMFW